MQKVLPKKDKMAIEENEWKELFLEARRLGLDIKDIRRFILSEGKLN